MHAKKSPPPKKKHRTCTQTREREAGWGNEGEGCHIQSCSELTSGPCLVLFLEKEIKNKNPNNSFSFRSASSRNARFGSEEKEAGSREDWDQRPEGLIASNRRQQHFERNLQECSAKIRTKECGRQDCLMILEVPINICDSLWCAFLRYACERPSAWDLAACSRKKKQKKKLNKQKHTNHSVKSLNPCDKWMKTWQQFKASSSSILTNIHTSAFLLKFSVTPADPFEKMAHGASNLYWRDEPSLLTGTIKSSPNKFCLFSHGEHCKQALKQNTTEQNTNWSKCVNWSLISFKKR